MFAGVMTVQFRQKEDGLIHLVALPHVKNKGDKGDSAQVEECERRETSDGEFSPEQSSEKDTVVGEVETLSKSQPILRLNYLKTLTDPSHETIGDMCTCTYTYYIQLLRVCVWCI